MAVKGVFVNPAIQRWKSMQVSSLTWLVSLNIYLTDESWLPCTGLWSFAHLACQSTLPSSNRPHPCKQTLHFLVLKRWICCLQLKIINMKLVLCLLLHFMYTYCFQEEAGSIVFLDIGIVNFCVLELPVPHWLLWLILCFTCGQEAEAKQP